MGDRAVISFTEDRMETSVNLYMHWGGSDRYSKLADALDAARPRWTDFEYATRICISNIIGKDWNEELGFGISTGEDRNRHGDYEPIIVCWKSGEVQEEHGNIKYYWGFEEFISFAEARKLHPAGSR